MNKDILLDTNVIITEYENGKTVKQLAEMFDVSVGTMYNALKSAGCAFRGTGRRKGSKMAPESIKKSAIKRRGIKRSDETRNRISESRKLHYNGLNGYGHTKKHNRGYELVYAPEHPNAHADGYVLKHTVVMERSIGRYLAPNEVVHHINHIRDDNRLENLELMDRHAHMAMHLKERKVQRRNDISIAVY